MVQTRHGAGISVSRVRRGAESSNSHNAPRAEAPNNPNEANMGDMYRILERVVTVLEHQALPVQ